MVAMPRRTTGCRNAVRLHQGERAVVSLTLIVVGFLVSTAVVMALARRSTARWERDRRAPVAARVELPDRRAPSTGAAPGIPGAVIRTVAALRSRMSRVPPVPVLGRLLAEGSRWVARARPVRRLRAVLRSLPSVARILYRWRTPTRSAAPPVEGDEGEGSGAGEASRATPGTDVVGAAERTTDRRSVPRARRRAPAFLHRPEPASDAGEPHEERGETPPSRV